MFNRDWVSNPETRRAVVGTAALLILAGAIWLEPHSQRQREAEQERGQAVAQNWRLNNPRIYQPECEKPESREESDLCAQQSMARVARDVYVLTWWQLVLGAFSLGAILFTLRETRIASRAALKSANAAVLAAEAAVRAADIERGFLLLRADVEVHQYSQDEKGARNPVTVVSCNSHFINAGRTQVVLWKQAAFLRALPRGEIPETSDLKGDLISGGTIIEPGDDWLLKVQKLDEMPVSVWQRSFVSAEFWIWFYGVGVYEDIHGIERYSRFRWKYDVTSREFGPYGGKPYNERT